jgi:hypothetical protein
MQVGVSMITLTGAFLGPVAGPSTVDGESGQHRHHAPAACRRLTVINMEVGQLEA